VTVEEALVALLAFAAGVLLFLGLAQALEGGPPASPRRAPHRARPARAPASLGLPAAERLPPPASPRLTPAAQGSPGEPLPLVESPPPREPLAWAAPAPSEPKGNGHPGPVPAEATVALEVDARSRETAAGILERCAGMFLGGKYREMLELTEAHLGPEGDVGSTAGTVLWTLAGMAHRELGEPAAAASALGCAVALAPDAPTEGCPPRLAALAMIVARRLLNPPEPAGSNRAAQARLANFWLRWRLVAAPGDPDALALLDGASASRAGAAEDQVAERLRERDWSGARQAIERARSEGDVDVARADGLERMLFSAVKREVDRLVAPAIRGTGDEARGVVGLERADQLLASLAPATLTQVQRATLARRTAWAQARIGVRRVRAGRFEAGADALAGALARQGLGAERQRRVRETLVEALEGMVGEAARSFVEPVPAVPRPAPALDLVDHLAARVAVARAAGVPNRLLAGVADKVRQLKAQAEQRLRTETGSGPSPEPGPGVNAEDGERPSA
jgi:hypothetical protein